jgi:hypothetical protein
MPRGCGGLPGIEMVNCIEDHRTPAAFASLQDLDRAEFNRWLDGCQVAGDLANDAAMGGQQGVSGPFTVRARFPSLL